jgi:hypothetical protein
MSRSEKRRRIRRLLAGALVGAAVFVPAAPAMPIYEAGDDGSSSAFVRAEGRPDGAVVSEPALRRDSPDGSVPQRYVTSVQQADVGSGFDWTSTGIGAGSAALLLALAGGGALIASRSRHGAHA